MIIPESELRVAKVLFRSRPMPDADAIIEADARADLRFHLALLAAFVAVAILALAS